MIDPTMDMMRTLVFTCYNIYMYVLSFSSSNCRCWLRYDTGFVWAFIAPVILIILVS